MDKAPILWITGIPASGKTTLARRIVRHFRGFGKPAEVIDGDDIRKIVSSGLGFSREDRLENNRRIAWIARLLARNGVIAVVASVSPYLEGRAEARKDALCDGLQFVEIYANCSLAVAKGRDSRNIYDLKDVTGQGAPYEAPIAAEIVVETDLLGPDDVLREVLNSLKIP